MGKSSRKIPRNIKELETSFNYTQNNQDDLKSPYNFKGCT